MFAYFVRPSSICLRPAAQTCLLSYHAARHDNDVMDMGGKIYCLRIETGAASGLLYKREKG